jgi:hypothetical protein
MTVGGGIEQKAVWELNCRCNAFYFNFLDLEIAQDFKLLLYVLSSRICWYIILHMPHVDLNISGSDKLVMNSHFYRLSRLVAQDSSS